MEEYYRDQNGDLLVEKRDALLQEYLREIDSSELHRRGIACALGSFPKFALRNSVQKIVQKLISCCTEITKASEKWAEGRRDCLSAMAKIAKTVGVETAVQGTFGVDSPGTTVICGH